MLEIRRFIENNKNRACMALVRKPPNGNSGGDTFIASATDIWEHEEPHPGKNYLGFICYDHKNVLEDLQSRHPARTGFPGKHFFHANEIHEFPVLETGKAKPPTQDTNLEPVSRVSRHEYIETVLKLQEHIQLGDIYEINYCIEFFAEKVSLDPVEIFFSLLSVSDAPFATCIKYGPSWLLGASPERFLRRRNGKLISQPVKGTSPRGSTEAEDLALAAALSSNRKERSENIMITDLVRNDLSRLAKKGSVKVDELCRIYPFRYVHQMISTVSCDLKENMSFPEIIRATFPMGSMTGAPKIRAMELIDRYEASRRELYSGCTGWFAENGDFDLSVVIRSICYNEETGYLSLMAGSAITAASDPLKEYEECLLKASGMMKALGADFRKFAG